MKEKKIPKWIKNKFLKRFLSSRTGRVISYWIFQGMLYADYREVLFKMSLDVLMTIILSTLFLLPVLLSIFISHTLNMFFNGHVIAMHRHMGLGANDPARFIKYIESFGIRVKSKPYILAAAAFGSLTHKAYRPTSDVDIRIVPKNDMLSLFRACLFALAERSRAFLFFFPLDLYVFDVSALKHKMSPQETPIVFHDPGGILENRFGNVFNADKVIEEFRSIHV